MCAALMAYSVYFRAQPTLAEDVISYSVNPFSALFKKTGNAVSAFFGAFSSEAGLNRENAALKKELAELKTQNERLQKIESEYIALTQLLNIDPIYASMDMLGATVIGKDPGLWYGVFLIDKGRADGVAANMPVIGPGGLIGRVMEAAAGYSKVRALLDESFAVSVKSVRTGDLGIVKGDMKLKEDGLCKMERIDIKADISAGDEIVTSDLGEIYPPGITVGYVKEISASLNGLAKTAVITPAADFKNVSHMLIVLNVRNPKGE